MSWLRAFWPAVQPDPWPDEIDQAVRDPDALSVCHHCFAPQSGEEWFCSECGTAVGPYNNMMPYLHVFSTGEVLRSGVGPAARFTMLTVPGYILLGLSEAFVLAPLYYVRLYISWRKARRAGGQDAPCISCDNDSTLADAGSGSAEQRT